MRTVKINLRARREQLGIIDLAAKLQGKSRADFICQAAYEKANACILDQVFFCLYTDRFSEFNAILEAPQRLNPGIERLMAIRPPWEGPDIEP
jgi:uncharacterized protein (DUF1778 family)